ncbi:MAG: hypothetical protein GC181_11525 [Bacteroidetes bacterium]|nr:hypothetical protein [Bacteroidota bacterium]
MKVKTNFSPIAKFPVLAIAVIFLFTRMSCCDECIGPSMCSDAIIFQFNMDDDIKGFSVSELDSFTLYQLRKGTLQELDSHTFYWDSTKQSYDQLMCSGSAIVVHRFSIQQNLFDQIKEIDETDYLLKVANNTFHFSNLLIDGEKTTDCCKDYINTRKEITVNDSMIDVRKLKNQVIILNKE